MYFAARRAVVLACLCALASFAQQQVTVDKLLEFLNSAISQKQPDKDIASVLATMKLSQKLDSRTIEELQGKGAGPKTVAALTHLSEVSAQLPSPAPKAEAPKPKPIPPPSYEEQQKVLNAAREYALNYSASLPDFICLQVTRRYVDPHYRPGAAGYWAISDRLAEKLSYFDQHEKYEPISRNDTSLYGKSTDAVGGALSRGDFGTLLKSVFDPASSAEFHWARWSNLDGHLMHVYTYSIDQLHSKETLDFARTQSVTPGYHGEIFVEKSSNEVWRATVEPEPPASFPMQNIREQLDYRYTDISGQKFLLPVRGEIVMRAEGIGSKNEIEFRSYRKYSADTSIKFEDSDDKTDQQPDDNAPKK
jgi:hypothetical protein